MTEVEAKLQLATIAIRTGRQGLEHVQSAGSGVHSLLVREQPASIARRHQEEPRRSLEVADLDLQRICENGRVEFMALDAGGEQELTLVTRQLIDLSLNQRAHRLRQVALDVQYRVGQRPAITLLDDGAAVAQVTKNVAHEERMTVGLRMNEVREVGRELVVRELQVDIRSHVVFAERC